MARIFILVVSRKYAYTPHGMLFGLSTPSPPEIPVWASYFTHLSRDNICTYPVSTKSHRMKSFLLMSQALPTKTGARKIFQLSGIQSLGRHAIQTRTFIANISVPGQFFVWKRSSPGNSLLYQELTVINVSLILNGLKKRFWSCWSAVFWGKREGKRFLPSARGVEQNLAQRYSLTSFFYWTRSRRVKFNWES